MLKVDAFNLLMTVINLLLLVVLMRIFLFKPVQKIIAARQAEADRQFAEAASKQKVADDLKQQYESSLSEAEEEKKQIIAEARKTADAEYQKIVSDAEQKASALKENAVVEANKEKAQILKKAEQQIADMVVDAATKVVGEKSGAATDAALYDKFLDKAGDES